VNVAAGDCRGGDGFPLVKFRKERSWPLCTEGRLRRAGTHPGKTRWRRSSGFVRARGLDDSGGNGVNPRVGNALQYTRPGREEESGEVVRNHGVGTRRKLAASSRRRASTRATGGSLPGVDSLTSKTTEGRSLDNPKRGSSDDRAGRRTAWGTMSGRLAAHQPEFEPQDRVASGKTARRSGG